MHRLGRAADATDDAPRGRSSVTAHDLGPPRGLPSSAPQPASNPAPNPAYLAGLDGLRAVAVIAVFLFHGGVSWMTGGYLAVSTFFTLSGFLITTLLIGERARTGTIRLRPFWERRIRRLLPAAVLAVALAAGVTLAIGDPGRQQAFAGDGVTTLFDVANWRFIAAGRSYGAAFDAPSALQHAWSLAIEAQFYWFLPLLAAVVFGLGRGRRRPLAVVLATLALASLALTRFAGFGHDRIYYGTDTRAAELLIGGLLAVLVAGRPQGILGPWSPAARRAIHGLGALAGLALVACWTTTPAAASWIDGGGLGLYAVASALVVLAASTPGTAVAGLLSTAWLRALGRISYGVYLFHWPILLLLAPDRVDWPAPVRLAVAGALTIGLAVVSYRFVEVPIRHRRDGLGRLPVGVVAVACAAVALVPTIVVARQAVDAPEVLDLAAGSLISDVDRLGPAPEADGPPPTITRSPAGAPAAQAPVVSRGPLVARPFTNPSRPLRVLVVGDSTAVYLDPPLDRWGTAHGVWTAANYGRIGCGIVRGGEARTPHLEGPMDDVCLGWADEWRDVVGRIRPDLIVLSSSFWDATDRRLPGDTVWRSPGDPVIDGLVRDGYREAMDVLTSTGAPVVWLDHPPITSQRATGPPPANPQVLEPERMARLDAIQAEVAVGRPLVRIVRTKRFFDAWPAGPFDPALRPDGIHVDGPGTAPLIDWLGPEILDAYWSVAG